MPQSRAVATLSSKETGKSIRCLTHVVGRTPDPDPRPDYILCCPKIGRDYFLLTSFKPPEPPPTTGGVHRPPRTD
ncbi:hypothetical protein NEUTE1DRAFT_55267 [Neurospora tetrasperma FGSC 2508]|uniref:Uncharacterized protein n=1 Tax=Neurospora tetrasperma (strain FGSC 2508 / ATCC MYA-4615 / P0657) TaxID=510951 RepID=F8N351_NEUT8|nr:uncharacterized protein NEUTE1DRAFT_55267 [Neurospora tetrasperma FGSC 2508]EGO52562.1 hypothetical protein NEUTE1DRAFT_55267 [Neurospora tetrasperma FGSC 2508]